MASYFLRVEAVNLSNIIDDTDDLSARRGGGLMALNAIRQLKEEHSTLEQVTRDQLTVIDIGASIALFKFEAADEKGAGEVAQAVRDHFRTMTFEYADAENESKTIHLALSYANFVVDHVLADANEYKAEQLAVAKNRWRQMREPSLSLVELWDDTSEFCFVDKTRPANSGERLPKDRNRPQKDKCDVSKSVLARHQYGRNAKTDFYRFEWESLEGPGTYPSYDFTNDFHEIAQHPKGDKQPLHNKLAVFYVDGNGFGTKGRDALSVSSEAFKQWASGIKLHHRQILRDLLKIAHADGDPLIRLETLLWGGDEILFVVPAWKGWELAKWFFGRKHEIGGKAVSYSGGLVFCNAKTPIKDVIHLVKEGLAEEAKNVARSIDQHRLSYAVLESFDNISELSEHRRRWLPKSMVGESTSCFTLDPAMVVSCWEPLGRIAASNEFPMRQLYMLCKAWRTESEEATKAALKRLMACDVHKDFKLVESDFQPKLSAPSSDPRGIAWLHLLEMLPYIEPAECGATK